MQVPDLVVLICLLLRRVNVAVQGQIGVKPSPFFKPSWVLVPAPRQPWMNPNPASILFGIRDRDKKKKKTETPSVFGSSAGSASMGRFKGGMLRISSKEIEKINGPK